MPAAEELASLIRERGPAVVLSGAGMSTESGIPDFRSAGGLWAQVDPYEVASIDAFRHDPLHVWRWYGPRVGMLAAAEPNEGHLALAELERDGHVTAVATQNIDALHTRAGSVDVLELHGRSGASTASRAAAWTRWQVSWHNSPGVRRRSAVRAVRFSSLAS